MSIRLGIIGAGMIGNVHAEAASATGTDIVAVFDVDLEKAERLSQRFGDNIVVAPSLEALVERDDLDAVVIAVPNVHHKSVAVKALQAGRNVLLEKPMAMSVEECDAIVDAVQKTGRKLMMGFVTRCAPAIQTAMDFIRAGKLGTIYHAKAQMYRQRGVPGLGRWFTNRAMAGGGVLIDLGVHQIDAMLHLTGRPKIQRVSGVCQSAFAPRMRDYTFTEMWAGPPDYDGVCDVEDGVTALLRSEHMSFELNVTWAANLPQKTFADAIILLGDKGGMVINVWDSRLVITTEQDGHVVEIRPSILGGDPFPLAFQEEHRRLSALVQSNEPSPAPAEHGREVQAILEAIYRSSNANEEVQVGALANNGP